MQALEGQWNTGGGLGSRGRLVSLGTPGLSLPLSPLRVDSNPGSAVKLLTSLGPLAYLGNGLMVPIREVDFEG